MSSNTLLFVHETLSLDLGVQTLAGLHGHHNEAVFLRTGSTTNTLLSLLTRVRCRDSQGMPECDRLGERDKPTAELALVQM